jgi:hypothetical protein
MKPGPQLDELIATHVFGWRKGDTSEIRSRIKKLEQISCLTDGEIGRVQEAVRESLNETYHEQCKWVDTTGRVRDLPMLSTSGSGAFLVIQFLMSKGVVIEHLLDPHAKEGEQYCCTLRHNGQSVTVKSPTPFACLGAAALILYGGVVPADLTDYFFVGINTNCGLKLA